MSTPQRPLAERYFEKINTSGGPDACHPWTGGTTTGGYGCIHRGDGSRRRCLAHRVGWALHFGPIPPGTFVCHSCDNPGCNNPRHWFLGTPSDNCLDREAKGRGYRPRGEQVSTHRLTTDEVRDIRLRSRQGESARSIARGYRVTHTLINNILHRKAWAHVA